MKYSNDQKEKAFEMMKAEFLKNGMTLPGNITSYRAIENDEIQQDAQIRALFCRILASISEPYLPEFSGRQISHPLDVEYFKEYRAPIMELLHSAHYTNVNSTIPYFAIMMYCLIRQFGCEKVLEIGIAEGYTSWYMCNAVKDNATRFKMEGNMYYGLDILNREEAVKQKLDRAGLPNTILQMDSMNLTEDTFKDIKFDLIFQDGAHDTEHVLHEFKVLWPQLKPDGYWLAHDCRGPAEMGCREIKRVLDSGGFFKGEYVDFGGMYGLLAIRKTEGLDPKKRHWNE